MAKNNNICRHTELSMAAGFPSSSWFEGKGGQGYSQLHTFVPTVSARWILYWSYLVNRQLYGRFGHVKV